MVVPGEWVTSHRVEAMHAKGIDNTLDCQQHAMRARACLKGAHRLAQEVRRQCDRAQKTVPCRRWQYLSLAPLQCPEAHHLTGFVWAKMLEHLAGWPDLSSAAQTAWLQPEQLRK